MVPVWSLFLVTVTVLILVLPDHGLVSTEGSKVITISLEKTKIPKGLKGLHLQSVDSAYINLKDRDDLYYTGVINIGSKGQKMVVVFDTFSSDLWVPSRSLCQPLVTDKTYCKSHNTYNSNASSTGHDLGKLFLINYGSGSVSGQVVTDDVMVSNLSIKGQTFGLATSIGVEIKKFGFDGVFGLGLPGLSELCVTPPFFNMISQKLVAKPVFAFYLSSSKPELVLGGVNPNHYRGPIIFTPVTGNTFWLFQIQRIRIGRKQVTSETFSATADSGQSLIMGPPAIIDSINAAIGKKADDGKTYVDCDDLESLPEIVFDISDNTFTLLSSDYIKVDNIQKDPSRRCYSGFSADNSLELVVLGEVFMAKYYTVFDIDKRQVGFAKSRK